MLLVNYNVGFAVCSIKFTRKDSHLKISGKIHSNNKGFYEIHSGNASLFLIRIETFLVNSAQKMHNGGDSIVMLHEDSDTTRDSH